MTLAQRTSFVVIALLAIVAPAALAATQGPFTLFHTLFHPDTNLQASSQQGDGVAMDGDRIVVGAAYAQTGGPNAGVANVYEASTGRFLMTLTNPNPRVSTQFGWGLAMSGTRAVIGAYWQEAGATNPSRVYVYDLAGQTPMLPVSTLTNPAPSGSDHYGFKVAISGTRVVVPAMKDDTSAIDSGIVYVFDLNAATPMLPVLTLTNPSPAVGDLFGVSVAISDNLILVGAGQDDTFDLNAGIAYVYDLAGVSAATPIMTLAKPHPAAGDAFGSSVSLSGTRAFVSASAAVEFHQSARCRI